MSPYHLLWIIPAVFVVIVVVWWVARRHSPSLPASAHLDPERVKREHERIKAEADARIEEIEKTADDWHRRLK